MAAYLPILPELLLLLGVAWALFAERLPGGDRGAVALGTLAALAAAAAAAFSPLGATLFGGALVFDGPARFARVGVAALAAVWLLWTWGRGTGRLREAVALALLSATGALVMCAATDLVTLVLALELATMPAYVLIGYRRRRMEGLEGALKYFLLSMLTSLVALYGMSFLYGVTGSTRYAELDLSAAGALGVLAVLLTFVGLFAKLSAAPFHYWTPDAYEGAEPWTVAFVSTVPKIAGALAIVRLTAALAPTAEELGPILVVIAAASMLLGNLAALTQTDVRRLMAYSGVAHTGYLLLGAAALTPVGYSAAVFYAVAYSLPSLGVMLVTAETGVRISDFEGLSQRRPAAAWSVVIMLVSLVGIPPLVGFFGKLYLFTAAIDAGLVWAALLGVLVSVVSAAYYLRIVRAMFVASESTAGETSGAENDVVYTGPAIGPRWAAPAAIAVLVLKIVALGLLAGPLLDLLGAV